MSRRAAECCSALWWRCLAASVVTSRRRRPAGRQAPTLEARSLVGHFRLSPRRWDGTVRALSGEKKGSHVAGTRARLVLGWQRARCSPAAGTRARCQGARQTASAGRQRVGCSPEPARRTVETRAARERAGHAKLLIEAWQLIKDKLIGKRAWDRPKRACTIWADVDRAARFSGSSGSVQERSRRWRHQPLRSINRWRAAGARRASRDAK